MQTLTTATQRGDPSIRPRTPKSAEQQQREKAALDKLLKDIDLSLDDGLSQRNQGRKNGKTQASGIVHDLRERLRHRSELRRARRAAQKAYHVNTRPSARKRAALMMGLGAMTMSTVAATSGEFKQPEAVMAPAVIDATQQRVHSSHITASDTFKQALIEEEGVRQTVYRDVAGYPTVGVGHLIRAGDNLRVGDRISYDQVLDFLEDDLAIAEEGVRRLVGDLPLYQHEFDALLDLVYNVGEGNVSERKSPRLNAAIAAGDYETIADELHYTTAAGKKARGLEFRSERRAAIFEQASYENPRDA